MWPSDSGWQIIPSLTAQTAPRRPRLPDVDRSTTEAPPGAKPQLTARKATDSLRERLASGAILQKQSLGAGAFCTDQASGGVGLAPK